MNSQGANLLAALMDAEDGVDQLVSMDLRPDIFNGEESDVFEYITKHMIDHGVLPSRETLEQDGAWELPTVPEPASFYLKRVEARYLHQSMQQTMLAATDLIKKKQRKAAFATLAEFVAGHTAYSLRRNVIDFDTDGEKAIKAAYLQKQLRGDDFGIKTGWQTYDAMNNGALGGDLNIIVGKTKGGKTYLMIKIAHHAWLAQKRRVMFVSMEMKPEALLNRLAAMHAKVPVTALNQAMLTSAGKKRLSKSLHQLGTGVPIFVVDGNLTATVQDIAMLARQYRPDLILVDGAYMLQPSKPNVRSWEAVVDTARGLKRDIASAMNLPVWASYQFTKEVLSKKKGDSIGLHNVAGSQEIPWLATTLLGITEEDTVENMKRKRVDILAGRNGEAGSFWTNWIFDTHPYMDFEEVTEKDTEGLSFV